MPDRTSLLAAISLAFVVGCGGTVIFAEDEVAGGEGEGGGDAVVSAVGGGPGGLGGGSSASVGATTTGIASSAAATTSSVASSTSVASSSSSGGGGFGAPDLFEQDLGAPAPDRNLFTLSETALGAYVAARAPSTFSSPVLDRLRAPSGSTVFDGPLPSNEAIFMGYGVSSLVVPSIQHPEMFPPATGTWSVRVEQASPSTRVSALERRTVDGAFHGGVLDVNVFLVPGVSDPDYVRSQVVTAFDGFAGLSLGEIRMFDAPDELFEVNDQNFFDAQEVTASAPPGQAVTLLAVGYIGGSLEGTAGFSPGAPADPIVHGSGSSTLVWWVQNDGFFDSIIVRHETGHYAGLFHTTEFDPSLVDPLDDTPSCPDLDFDNFESCPDFDFVMFPTGGSGAGVFSPSQQAVIQGSAIYRGVFAPGELPAAPFEGLVGEGIAAPPAAALALDGRGVAARAPAGPSLPSARAALPAAIAALDGIGCATGGPVEPLIAAAASAATARELVDHARDGRLAPLLRMRALLAAARAPGASALADDLAALAADAGEPEPVRAGALRALGRVAPARRALLVPTLRTDASRLVRHLAR
jgi:hypothetical protein